MEAEPGLCDDHGICIEEAERRQLALLISKQAAAVDRAALARLSIDTAPLSVTSLVALARKAE